MARERSQWQEITSANPAHSAWYIERFRTMAEQGHDLDGEARLVDAMVGRRARILDAGCGPGRVGGYLHGRGHDVVGVDVDHELIAAAEQDHPGPTWLVGDLADLADDDTDLSSRGIPEGFDLVVCAGNVMTFLAPSTRRDVLLGFRRHLREGGRVVLGFGLGRGYELADLDADAEAAGLRLSLRLGTWDVRPFDDDSDFAVSILVAAC